MRGKVHEKHRGVSPCFLPPNCLVGDVTLCCPILEGFAVKLKIYSLKSCESMKQIGGYFSMKSRSSLI